MNLEVKVKEEIQVFDIFENAIRYIINEIKKWFESEDQRPITIIVSKNSERGPPTLGVNISERVRTNEALS